MDYLLSRFEQAASLLPSELRKAADKLSPSDKALAEEFRLRTGRVSAVRLPGGEKSLVKKDIAITKHDLLHVLDIATCSSMHTSIESIRSGFITAIGGHRVGICGSAAVKDGEIVNIINISSLCIRISKEIKGVSDAIIGKLLTGGAFENTLLIAPPGMGKTTLLRDIIRRLGESFRVAVADERGEIAAARDGTAQFDIGLYTDVMDNCPKAAAMMLLLRSMSPQIIAADEITAPEDIKAFIQAANCGIKLLATAHAYSKEEFYSRPLYKDMLNLKLFKKLVTINIENGKRIFSVTDLR